MAFSRIRPTRIVVITSVAKREPSLHHPRSADVFGSGSAGLGYISQGSRGTPVPALTHGVVRRPEEGRRLAAFGRTSPSSSLWRFRLCLLRLRPRGCAATARHDQR